MGCGSSKAGGVQAAVPTAEDAQAVPQKWATKTEVGSASPQVKASNAPVRGDGGAGPGESHAAEIVMSDADGESEIEIIYEGKPKQQQQQEHALEQVPSIMANAQEAPDEGEAHEAKQRIAMEREQAEISERQKEEAAKLAEQRKRFDNQRYQREAGAEGPIGQVKSPAGAENPAPVSGVDLVMGLNLAAVPGAAEGVRMLEDCLPGGIMGDTPREPERVPKVSAVDKNRSKHDRFDDDDERLMNDILESIEA